VRSQSQAALWRCPRCGHRFVTRNLSHSCVRVSLPTHLAGRPTARKQTWNRWVAAARACGPITAYAQKTRIVIQARVRFAGAVVRSSYLDANLWLRRRVEHPRLRRVEDFHPIGYVHHFRLEQPSDIDEALTALMLEAYRVGTQKSTRTNPLF
jgi:hypothetical protein